MLYSSKVMGSLSGGNGECQKEKIRKLSVLQELMSVVHTLCC